MSSRFEFEDFEWVKPAEEPTEEKVKKLWTKPQNPPRKKE